MDGLEDFLAVDGDFCRGNDAQPDLVAADLDDRHRNIVIDDDRFILLP